MGLMATLRIVTPLSRSCLYRHASVWANGKVYHLNESGAHCDSEEAFMRTRKVIRETKATKSDAEVEAYYRQVCDKPFSYITYNCEHFAYGAAFGKEQSPTVKGYIIAAFAVACVAASIYWYYKRH